MHLGLERDFWPSQCPSTVSYLLHYIPFGLYFWLSMYNFHPLSVFVYLATTTKNVNDISSLVWLSLFCKTQNKIFWRMLETNILVTIDFHSIDKKIFDIRFIQHNTRVSKWCQNFLFLVESLSNKLTVP